MSLERFCSWTVDVYNNISYSRFHCTDNNVFLVYSTVEPRLNEPLYNEALGITNDILQFGPLKYMEQNLDITNLFP